MDKFAAVQGTYTCNRRNHPGLPILFVTGFAGAALPAPDGSRDGSADRLLRKPFHATELAASVAALLEDSAGNGANLTRWPV